MVGPLRDHFGIEMKGCTDLWWDAPKRCKVDAKRRDGYSYQAIYDDMVTLYGEGNAPSPSMIRRYLKFKAGWPEQMRRNNRIGEIDINADAFGFPQEYFQVAGHAGQKPILFDAAAESTQNNPKAENTQGTQTAESVPTPATKLPRRYSHFSDYERERARDLQKAGLKQHAIVKFAL